MFGGETRSLCAARTRQGRDQSVAFRSWLVLAFGGCAPSHPFFLSVCFPFWSLFCYHNSPGIAQFLFPLGDTRCSPVSLDLAVVEGQPADGGSRFRQTSTSTPTGKNNYQPYGVLYHISLRDRQPIRADATRCPLAPPTRPHLQAPSGSYLVPNAKRDAAAHQLMYCVFPSLVSVGIPCTVLLMFIGDGSEMGLGCCGVRPLLRCTHDESHVAHGSRGAWPEPPFS